MAKEVISKRNFIHANIIEELNAKYPLYSEKNGVAYSRDLKYITFEPSVDFDANIIALDVSVGFGVFNVIVYFAEEMMKGGYKTRVDGHNLERHCLTCSGKYGVPADKVRKIVESLVNCNYFFKIADESYQYYTTCQAVYNYERCMNTRLENRKRKEKSREKFKQLEQAQNMLPAPPPPLPLPEYPPQNQEYGYPAVCNQEYNYPCTCSEEYDALDEIEEELAWRQQNGLDSVCDEYEPPDPIGMMMQEEMAILAQQGISLDSDAYDPPDPVGDMIQEEREWQVQHGLSCDDAMPDDFNFLIPYSDEIAN